MTEAEESPTSCVLIGKRHKQTAEEKKEYQRQYYLRNKAKIDARNKAYAESNKEKVKAQQADWYAKNKDRCAENQRKRWAKDPERCRKMVLQWHKDNPVRSKENAKKYYRENRHHAKSVKLLWRRSNKELLRKLGKKWKLENPHRVREHAARRRALIQGSDVSESKLIMAWERRWRSSGEQQRCYWCESRFDISECHTEHILALTLGGDHSMANVCISCGPCNLTKARMSLEEWNTHLTSPVLL